MKNDIELLTKHYCSLYLDLHSVLYIDINFDRINIESIRERRYKLLIK